MTQSHFKRRVLGSLTTSLVVLAMAGAAPTGRGGHRAERETLRRAQQFLDRLEQKDTEAIAATLHPEVTFTHPLSLSGKREDAARWQGKDRVLGYLGGATTMMDRIRFTNQRFSVAAGGGTAFFQADGDLTAADGRPYQNVYIFRIDWRGDQIIAIEEYANPLTFCQTFSNPLCAGRPASGDQRTPGGGRGSTAGHPRPRPGDSRS